MRTDKLTLELWYKARAIYSKAIRDGIDIGRVSLANALNISERLGGYLNFALKNKSILNCIYDSIETNDGDLELSFGDVHIPYQDNAAIQAMFEYCKDKPISIITIMGDLLDFYQISSFPKNPLRSKRLFQEIEQGKEFLRELRERFPDARIIFYQGNHEYRLESYIMQNASQLAELVSTLLIDKLELKSLNIEYITEPFSIGKLWHLHGHEKPSGSYNPEHILNMLIQYIGDHFLTFHYHRTQSKSFKRIGNRFWNAHSVGGLFGDMDYAKLTKWNQGFCLIQYDKEGNFRADNKVIQDGVVF